MRKLIVALLPVFMLAGAGWALEVGDEAPATLNIHSLNHEKDDYDMIATSKGEGGIVFVRPDALTEDAVAKLIGAIEAIHAATVKEGHELHTAVIVVGPKELEPKVKEALADKGFAMDWAVIPADELADWKLGDDFKVVFLPLSKGKVEAVITTPEQFEEFLKKKAG